MAREYTTRPARLLQRPARYVRTDLGADADLERLGRSYLERPLYPIIADAATLETYDGNRRVAAVLRVDPTAEVPVCLIDEPWTDAVKLEIQAESAAHTRGLSDYERYAAAAGWLELHPGATARQFAARTHTDETVVSKLLSLAKCIPAVQDAAREGRIGYKKWHPISQRPAAEQAAALAACLDGAPRDELRRGGGRRGGGRAGTVTARNLPLVLTSGLAVTFKGADITLTQALDALAEVRRELDDVIKRDHDARTFAALMKKRARQMARAAARGGGAG